MGISSVLDKGCISEEILNFEAKIKIVAQDLLKK